ncbi:MAG: transporter substrate-binding domain-containing protein [Acutalibacteraceae bacterium]
MKKVLALVLAAVMVLSLAACGGAGTTAAKVKVIDINLTEEEYAFGVDKNQPELLEQVNTFIEKIMKDGTFDSICDKYFGSGEPTPVKSAVEDSSKDQLVVATNAAFAPFEYKEGDSFYGIDMEIADLLAKELGKELVISDMKFESVCLSVGQHKCDIAMAGLTVNEERKEQVTFSTSYYQAAQKLIVKADDTTFDACKETADVETILNGFDNTTKIGYQNGTTAKYYVEGDEDWGFAGLKVEGKGYDNGALAVQDMLNGNINYVMIDAAPAARIAETINAA